MLLYRTEVKPATNPAMRIDYSEFDSLFSDYEKDLI